MAITFIGSTSGGLANGADVTLNLAAATPSTPSDGDIVIAFGGAFGRAGNEARVGNALSYAEIFDQTNTNRLRIGYKVYASGENSVVIESSGNAADATTGVALIFRGMDPSQPDVTNVSTTGTSLNPNLDAVTPSSNDCAIIAAVASTANDASVAAPSNYTDVHANGADTNSCSLSAAYRILTGGAGSPEDPPNWTSWGSGTWQGATIALRPTVVGTGQPAGKRLGGVPFANYRSPFSMWRGIFLPPRPSLIGI